MGIFSHIREQKFHLSAHIKLRVKSRKDEYFFPKQGRNTRRYIAYYPLIFFIAHAFKGHMHVFAGQVKIVSHSSCRTNCNIEIFLSPVYHILLFPLPLSGRSPDMTEILLTGTLR